MLYKPTNWLLTAFCTTLAFALIWHWFSNTISLLKLYLAILFAFIWPNFGIRTETKVVSQCIAVGLTDLQFRFTEESFIWLLAQIGGNKRPFSNTIDTSKALHTSSVVKYKFINFLSGKLYSNLREVFFTFQTLTAYTGFSLTLTTVREHDPHSTFLGGKIHQSTKAYPEMENHAIIQQIVVYNKFCFHKIYVIFTEIFCTYCSITVDVSC